MFALERLRPARPAQRWLRPGLLSDLAHLVFNGHILGAAIWVASSRWLWPLVEPVAPGWLYTLQLFAAQPVVVQIIAALFIQDFMQWWIHRLLHRVPALWRFHQIHHSVVDGEMDWIVSFRFSWVEIIVYRSLQYLPLAVMGFGTEAIMFHAVFGTLIGHLNHANVRLDYGPLRYLLNSPAMHLWHHDAHGPKHGWNFGIIFSCWDWLLGTAHLPDHPPKALGFPGVQDVPRDFLAQEGWPLASSGLARLGGGLLVASGLWVLWG